MIKYWIGFFLNMFIALQLHFTFGRWLSLEITYTIILIIIDLMIRRRRVNRFMADMERCWRSVLEVMNDDFEAYLNKTLYYYVSKYADTVIIIPEANVEAFEKEFALDNWVLRYSTAVDDKAHYYYNGHIERDIKEIGRYVFREREILTKKGSY